MRVVDDDAVGNAADAPSGGVSSRFSRRKFLAAAGAASVAGLAGCTDLPGLGSNDEDGTVTMSDFRGSGPLVEQRDPPGGTPMADLPDLSGTLRVYLGGGEGGLYLELIELLERLYPDFEVRHKIESSSNLANTIIEESNAGQSPADVFLAVDAGSLGAVANAGAAADLPSEVLDPVPETFRTDNWVGFAGRARSIPFNTDQFDQEDIPDSIQAFADGDFGGQLGWAPTYGAFQSFVTAMRLLRGDEETKAWLTSMKENAVASYPDEFRISNAVADGELAAGFANHYYALRVQSARPDAPLDLAFTSNDAGALVNVSGAEIIEGTDDEELATNFVRHFLSAEAQEFFATRTFAYPMIPGVAPVGGLPTIDELDPPEIDLTKLSAVDETLDLMREAGVL